MRYIFYMANSFKLHSRRESSRSLIHISQPSTIYVAVVKEGERPTRTGPRWANTGTRRSAALPPPDRR